MTRLVALVALVALAATAAPVRDVRTLLSDRAPVDAPAGEIARLELGPEVLARCQPDLADLRLVAASGTAVPFVIDSAEDPAATGSPALVTRSARITNVERTEERQEHGPTRWRETYELAVEGETPVGEADWELRLSTVRRRFVRHVDVEALDDAGGTRTLAMAAPVFTVDEAGDLVTARRTVPLSAFAPRLRVTIDGEGDGWLEPSFLLQATRSLPAVARARIVLDVLARSDANGTTTLDLALPGALVPDRLALATSTDVLRREIAVFRAPSRPDDVAVPVDPVGRGVIARQAPGAPLDPAEIPLRLRSGGRLPPGTKRLRVTIANGDSPPLADLVVTALVPVPVLLFVAPPESLDLYFGGTRVQAARYDVAALAAVWRSAFPDDIADASLGAVGPNPDYDPTPLLDVAMQPAKPVDRRLFTHARPLAIPATPDGLAHVDLDVGDLVVARADLADVRVVDAGDRQWPYVVEEAPVHRWTTVPLEPLASAEGWSRHRLHVAAAPVPADRIEIAPPAPVVDREVRLLSSDAADATLLAHGTIGRGPFVATLDGRRHETLVVAVRDGDEQPLALAEARVRLALPRLDVVAPAGDYTLLLGDSDAHAPEYGLARIRGLVGEARGETATAGQLGPNPAYSARAGLLEGGWLTRLGPTIALWSVLVGSGLLLVVITLRTVRRTD